MLLYLIALSPAGLMHEDLTRMIQRDIREDVVFLEKLNLMEKKVNLRAQRKTYSVSSFFRNYVLTKMST